MLYILVNNTCMPALGTYTIYHMYWGYIYLKNYHFVLYVGQTATPGAVLILLNCELDSDLYIKVLGLKCNAPRFIKPFFPLVTVNTNTAVIGLMLAVDQDII